MQQITFYWNSLWFFAADFDIRNCSCGMVQILDIVMTVTALPLTIPVFGSRRHLQRSKCFKKARDARPDQYLLSDGVSFTGALLICMTL